MKRISGLIMVTLLVTLCFQLQSSYAQVPTDDTVFVGNNVNTLQAVAQVIRDDGSTRATRAIGNPNAFLKGGVSELFNGVGEPRILFCFVEQDPITFLITRFFYEIRDRDLNLVRARVVLNPDFDFCVCDVLDVENDGVEEIVFFGVDFETTRTFVQVFRQNTGALLTSRPVLNPNFENIFPLFD